MKISDFVKDNIIKDLIKDDKVDSNNLKELTDRINKVYNFLLFNVIY